jgi:hypothetical protein
MSFVVPLLVGPASALIVEACKRLPFVPIIAGQTAKLRTLAAGLSAAGTVVHAVATGDVDALGMYGEALASYLVSYLTYKGIISDPHKPVENAG